MNPKEQAEIIVDRFYNIDPNAPNYLALSKRQTKEAGIIALEMLIEANPTQIEYIGDRVDPLLYEKKITCNKAHYKEVLKAIKNME